MYIHFFADAGIRCARLRLCRFNRMRGSDRINQAYVCMQGLVGRFIFYRAGWGGPM